MAERKSQNKYYPPDWSPSKGSINKFRGQHPLRERARKLSQGILVVRFELPFNIWCEGCQQHIGKGVRFNAEKKQVGKYYSTKIWNFRMKCPWCSHFMEINTDPEHSDFLVVKGARKKNEEWEDGPEAGTIRLIDEDEARRLAEDPFYKLEHSTSDQQKAREVAPDIQKLVSFREEREDDYKLSYLARHSFREQKKELEKRKKEGEARGLGTIPLLPMDESDRLLAASTQFSSGKKLSDLALKEKLHVKSTSIFAKSSGEKSTNARLKLQKLQVAANVLAARGLKRSMPTSDINTKEINTKRVKFTPEFTVAPMSKPSASAV